MVQQKEETHALAIGGGFGGLLAARVLAGHYRQGSERHAEHRRGVPQGRHTHGLLASGSQILEWWFPGILQELIKAGAVPGQIGAAGRWFIEGACLARFKS